MFKMLHSKLNKLYFLRIKTLKNVFDVFIFLTKNFMKGHELCINFVSFISCFNGILLAKFKF